jgi:hypothetical protein
MLIVFLVYMYPCMCSRKKKKTLSFADEKRFTFQLSNVLTTSPAL